MGSELKSPLNGIINLPVIFCLLIIYPVSATAYLDTNLVVNPGFENGITAPLNWTFFPINENIPAWSNVSHTGSRSVEISIPGTNDLQSGYPESDLIIAQPFTNYTISAWGKTQNVNGTNPPIVRIAELDKDMNLFGLVNLPFSPGTNDWEQKRIEFQTGSNTKYLYVYADIWNGYGNFWLDDVIVSQKTNLAANPGFENGITAPLNWTFFPINENIPVWSNVSHTGSRSVEISIPGTTDLQSGYPESDLIIAQPFTNYTISVWGKTQNVNGTNPPIVRIAELDKDMNLFGLVDLPFSQGTNDWEQKRIEFQTGSNTAYFYIYASIWGGNGNFWMDDVELNMNNTHTTTPTPTPASTPTATSTPTPASTPTATSTPTPAQTLTPAKPEIGVYNRESVASIDDPLMKWQIIASSAGLTVYSQNNRVGFNLWSDWSKTKSKWTDIGPNGFIQNRFNLANKYKNEYEYVPFLLHEEMFGPIALSTWAEPLNTWQLEGKATFNGIEIKLLKTWIIEDKGQAWNQAWWDGLKAGSDDPLLKEWEVYYTTNLYKAWNEYVHSLGKKSMVIGFMSTQNSNYDADIKYQMPAYNYVLANYDAIVDYSFPTSSAKVSYSLNKIKYLRSKYTAPNGKVIWILTGSFSDWEWTWAEAVAQSEFNAVAPYADVIMTYPFTNMGSRTNPYPKYLLKFYHARYG